MPTLYKSASIAHVINSQKVNPLRVNSRVMRAIESIAPECYENDSEEIDSLDFSYLNEVNLEGLFE